MPFRRLIALMLDLLLPALGAVAGGVVALVTVPVSNTVGSLGNVVVFAYASALGCVVSWFALAGIITFSGRSPGQRLMGLCYDESAGRARRAYHCLLAWLVPIGLLVAPSVSLNLLNAYRETTLERWDRQHDWTRRHDELAAAADDLRYAHRDDRLTQSAYLEQKREFDEKLEQMQRERRNVVWFVPERLVQADGILWLLLHGTLLCAYAIVTLALLLRPPHTTVHDRVAGVRIISK